MEKVQSSVKQIRLRSKSTNNTKLMTDLGLDSSNSNNEKNLPIDQTNTEDMSNDDNAVPANEHVLPDDMPPEESEKIMPRRKRKASEMKSDDSTLDEPPLKDKPATISNTQSEDKMEIQTEKENIQSAKSEAASKEMNTTLDLKTTDEKSKCLIFK